MRSVTTAVGTLTSESKHVERTLIHSPHHIIFSKVTVKITYLNGRVNSENRLNISHFIFSAHTAQQTALMPKDLTPAETLILLSTI